MRCFTAHLCLYLLGCGTEENNLKETRNLTHETGLSVTLPFTPLKVTETEYGYIFSIGPTGTRQIDQITIEILSAKPNALTESKTINNVTYYLTEEICNEGSSGPEYEPTIWKPTTDASGILIERHTQSNRGENHNAV